MQKTQWRSLTSCRNSGDLITADHKVLSENCESRNNHRYGVVVQDLATQRIQSYPCKNKTSQETQRSLQKFLEPDRKPKVIYTDNSFEFGKACEDLSWKHCTSTPHRSETNGIAERAMRRVEAINDFWSMSGNFMYRHHVEPRVKLFSPREESFPIPLKYINASRTTNTNLDVMQERRIDEYWNIDGSRDLSDPWTGFEQFALLEEQAPERYMWSGERLTRKQLASRPDRLRPEQWDKKGKMTS